MNVHSSSTLDWSVMAIVLSLVVAIVLIDYHFCHVVMFLYKHNQRLNKKTLKIEDSARDAF